jgi:Mg-chelatase subunit ChlI
MACHAHNTTTHNTQQRTTPKTRLAFEADPEAFLEQVRPEQEALTAKLVAAQQRLNK